MCVCAISLDPNPDTSLIAAFNRDEFYARPTSKLQFWEEEGLYAGKDLVNGGTWLGVNPAGKLAMLTHFRNAVPLSEDSEPRGRLVVNFLSSAVTPGDYLEALKSDPKKYGGFNLIFGSLKTGEFLYFSNVVPGAGLTIKTPGCYGLSNGVLDSDWQKVDLAKEALTEASFHDDPVDFVLQAFRDSRSAPDSSLPDTGYPIDIERALSPMFIVSPEYGTKSTTVIVATKSGLVKILEVTYDTQGEVLCKESVSFTAVDECV